MNRGVIAVLCLLLAGCDYEVPLVTTPAVAIDRAAIGLWSRTNDRGEAEQLLLLPLGEREYLASFPAGSGNALFARATLWRDAAMTLAQIDWIGTARGTLLEDERTFQYAAYAVAGDTLTLRLVNPEVVPKTLASTEALARTLREQRDHPALYRPALVFHRVAN
jgi:hypothetical protein